MVMVFFLAILPSVIDIRSVGLPAWLELAGCAVVVLGATMLAYAALAAQAGRLVGAPKYLKIANRTSGAVMAGAAVAIVARS